jgi:hypothetical protein
MWHLIYRSLKYKLSCSTHFHKYRPSLKENKKYYKSGNTSDIVWTLIRLNSNMQYAICKPKCRPEITHFQGPPHSFSHVRKFCGRFDEPKSLNLWTGIWSFRRLLRNISNLLATTFFSYFLRFFLAEISRFLFLFLFFMNEFLLNIWWQENLRTKFSRGLEFKFYFF